MAYKHSKGTDGDKKDQAAGPNFRESIINLDKYKNQEIRVTFLGGRQIKGILKQFDTGNNMVLDECVEYLRG